jgi:hypothetical protein
VVQPEGRAGRSNRIKVGLNYPEPGWEHHGEEDARRENGSGKEAIIEASGRKGTYRQARGRPSHHEDLSHPSELARAGDFHRQVDEPRALDPGAVDRKDHPAPKVGRVP